ncbi:MAG: saccharopine dehydrogenase NADP-binding domain-containing protein [Cyclobacteriaceae bacterium]
MKYMVYGAYGYTGKLVVEQAKKKGHDLVLAGRNQQELEALSEATGYSSMTFDLSDTSLLVEALSKVKAVLHCAGPFSDTAKPMVEACIQAGVHYIDITGEVEIFEQIATYDEQANQAGIMLLPGAGFDVVPTDCMAVFLKEKMPDATSLELGFKSSGGWSKGTALTMVETIPKGGAVRENGKIRKVPNAYKIKWWQVEGKNLSFVSIPWGDVATAYRSTGIPNITTYTALPPRTIQQMKNTDWFRPVMGLGLVQKILKNQTRKRFTGPDKAARESGSSYIWGEATDSEGKSIKAELRTREGYLLTALTSTLIMQKIIEGRAIPGYQTPAKAFGHGLISEIEGTELKVL